MHVWLGAVAMTLAAAVAAERPGVAPEGPWACPPTHPIKGYVLSESGRRVYFRPESRFYDETSPERCYADEEQARRDGARPAPEHRRAPREGPTAAATIIRGRIDPFGPCRAETRTI